MAIKVEKDRVVTLAYRLTDSEGRLLEERTPEKPYEYLHGRGQINLAVEHAIEGKTPGHRAEVSLSPAEGYGQYHPSLVADMPRNRFPANVDVKVGMKFNTMGPDGKQVVVRVIEVDDENVTVDGNHPLAGLDLIFELRVLDVREATPAELNSGRIGVAVSVGSIEDESEGGGGTVH